MPVALLLSAFGLFRLYSVSGEPRTVADVPKPLPAPDLSPENWVSTEGWERRCTTDRRDVLIPLKGGLLEPPVVGADIQRVGQPA